MCRCVTYVHSSGKYLIIVSQDNQYKWNEVPLKWLLGIVWCDAKQHKTQFFLSNNQRVSAKWNLGFVVCDGMSVFNGF